MRSLNRCRRLAELRFESEGKDWNKKRWLTGLRVEAQFIIFLRGAQLRGCLDITVLYWCCGMSSVLGHHVELWGYISVLLKLGAEDNMFLYWKKRGAYELEALPPSFSQVGIERYSWSSSLDVTHDLCGKLLDGGWGRGSPDRGTHVFVPIYSSLWGALVDFL